MFLAYLFIRGSELISFVVVCLFTIGLMIMLGVFSLVKFKFISMLLLIENFKVLILLVTYIARLDGLRILFLVFMVVATIEVTLALVSLTRLWDSDSLVY